ncbi:MAG: arsenate reductase ArsC [Gammaproteobacteria bacterium]|jgi:arsenate reductase|nr:arsenate reductase ArsC [Gammaproteobacteria bacterium]
MKLLYICTHNRCRSILCEALTNHLAQGRIIASSAGSTPAAAVHPLTLAHLRARGLATAGLYSKSWEDVAEFQPDVVVTVCDSAANEACPVWMGAAPKVHWGLPDPSRAAGSDAEIAAAFERVSDLIERRIRRLLEVDLASLDAPALAVVLNELAREEAA